MTETENQNYMNILWDFSTLMTSFTFLTRDYRNYPFDNMLRRVHYDENKKALSPYIDEGELNRFLELYYPDANFKNGYQYSTYEKRIMLMCFMYRFCNSQDMEIVEKTKEENIKTVCQTAERLIINKILNIDMEKIIESRDCRGFNTRIQHHINQMKNNT